MAGSNKFLFVENTAAMAEKLHPKALLWDNALRGNIWTSMAESSQLLSIISGPLHMDYATAEVNLYGFVELLVTLWSDYHPLVSDLLSLVHQNYRERRGCIYWAMEYDMIQCISSTTFPSISTLGAQVSRKRWET